MSCDSEQLGVLLETAFAALSPAVDGIIEWLSAQVASEEMLQMREDIATYVTVPELAEGLA